MLLEVIRDTFTEKSTTGMLFVDRRFQCYTLEDKDRELEKYPDRKIYGKTAIPRGKYEVELYLWPKYGKKMPLLTGVPGYSGIFIHPGNTPEHTEGCLLLGLERREDFIGHSADAFAEVYAMITKAIESGDKVYVSVV